MTVMKRRALFVAALSLIAGCGGGIDSQVASTNPLLDTTSTTPAPLVTTTTDPNQINNEIAFENEVVMTYGRYVDVISTDELHTQGYAYCEAANGGMSYDIMLETIAEGAESEARAILERAIVASALTYLCDEHIGLLPAEIDLSTVDWDGLAEIQAAEEEAARQASVDAARAFHGKCGEWHDLALEVGWTEEEWPWLSGVLFRESRCQSDAWNGADAGLSQINQIHRKWLSDMGWNHPDDMFDPRKNLTFALMLYRSSGCRPWRSSNSCPSS